MLRVHNIKEEYVFNEYNIVFEDVKDLGYFIEVEYCTNDDVSIKQIKDDIQKFIDDLNISVSEELNMGKPEMFLRKNNVNVLDE